MTVSTNICRQELERQRLKEWEETRKQELSNHRQREEEKVMTLKAKQEHINKDLEALVNLNVVS